MTAAVIVSLRIAASPRDCFDAFVDDIGLWWRPNQLFQLTPRGDGELRFEPGENGRLVTTLSNGHVFEIGRITHWAPGDRLSFTWRQATFTPEQQTSVDVRFEAIGRETRVTVEHRGWDAIPQEHLARHGFPLGPFQMRQAEHWRTLLVAFAEHLAAHG